MPTLRESLRQALTAAEPTNEEAAADLRAVLYRARQRARRRTLGFVLVPALAAASIATYFAVGNHDANPNLTAVSPAPSPHVAADLGVFLYLRADGEPEDRAMTLNLVVQGEL